MKLDCRKVTEILIDFVEESLPEEEQQLLQRHLCGCVPCAIYLQSYRQTIRLTHTLPDAPIPPELANRLLAAMRDNGCDRSEG